MPDRYHDLVPDYVAGALDDAAARDVAAHLAACAACRAEEATWRAIAGGVRRLDRTRRAELPAYRPPERAEAARGVVPMLPLGGASPSAIAVSGSRPGQSSYALERSVSAAGSAGEPTSPLAAGEAPHGRGTVWRVLDGAGPWRLAAAVTLAAGVAGLYALSRADGGADRAARPAAPHAAAPSAPPATAIARRPTPVGRAAAVVVLPEDAPSGPVAGSSAAARGPAEAAGAPAPPPVAGPASPVSPPTWPAEPPDRVPPTAAPPTAAPATAPPSPADPTAAASDQPTAPATPTEPPPSPPATPTAGVPVVAGTVLDGDGMPLAGARVVAEPYDRAGAGSEGITGADGRFALAVAPGSWLVHVEADGFSLMWNEGRATPLGARPVEVGGPVELAFHLEPVPGGLVRGRVVDGAGAPLPRALVLAAPPDRAAGGARPPLAATYTGPDGAYALPVPPGAWLIASTTDWRAGALRWWGGDGSLERADAVPVGAAPASNIDLTLRP